jgi:hypothetical protein
MFVSSPISRPLTGQRQSSLSPIIDRSGQHTYNGLLAGIQQAPPPMRKPFAQQKVNILNNSSSQQSSIYLLFLFSFFFFPFGILFTHWHSIRKFWRTNNKNDRLRCQGKKQEKKNVMDKVCSR